MELINRRYRIIKNIIQSNFISTHLATDIVSNNKINFNIINSEYLPDELKNFLTNEFITLTGIKCSNIVSVSNFGLINFIDNKRVGNYQYYYTNEHIENGTSLAELVRQDEIPNFLDIFAHICTALNYLHLKGHSYGELNLNNIIIKQDQDSTSVKLIDIVTTQLQKYNYQVSKNEYIAFKAPELLKGEHPSIVSDIYSLGIVLSSLSKNNSSNELSAIIDKMTSHEIDKRYKSIYEVIQDVNKLFETDYRPFIKEELEQLNFKTKLIGREYEIDKVVNGYGNRINNEYDKNVVLVHGGSGIGKTRFLEELAHIFRMRNETVLSSFSLDNNYRDSNKGLMDILKKIMIEAEPQLIEKYRSSLMNFFPELNIERSSGTMNLLNDEKSRFKLLNGISGFISDFLANKQGVFILDNLHLSDDFCVDLVEYLYTKRINAKSILCIISYCDGGSFYNRKLSEFIKRINNQPNVIDISMHGLSDIETGCMLQDILSMPHNPEAFASKIYSKTYGNPRFVQEIIKTLYANKVVYVDGERGVWMSSYEFDEIPFPTNIQQAVLNQINDLDKESKQVLDVISVFNNAVSVDVISKFFSNKKQYIQIIIDDMVQRGIICKKIEDRGFVFDFSNIVLKNLIYNKLDEREKILRHEMAVEILENQDEFEKGSREELIYHLEKSGNKSKVIKYCIENAKKMECLRNRSEAIKSIEKAVSMYDENEINMMKMSLLIKLGEFYKECGSITNAIGYYEESQKIAEKLKEYEKEIDIINKITSCFLDKNDIKSAEKYIEKAGKKVDSIKYTKGYLLWQRNILEVMLINDKYQEAFELCGKCIDMCGNEYMDIKGHFYSKRGNIYAFTSDIENALKNYEEGINCFKIVHNEEGIAVSLNNIGVIYSDNYQDMSKAIDYFIKTKEISEKNNFILTETLALTNIASTYCYRMEYDVALRNFKEALEKAKNIEYESNILYCYSNICSIYLKLREYKKAYKNYKYAEKELVKYPLQKKDISAVFFATGAELYFEYGDMDKASWCNKRVAKIYGNDDVKARWENYILGIYIKIVNKVVFSPDDIDSIKAAIDKLNFNINKLDTAYNLCILLLENGYIEEAKQFFNEVKEINSDYDRIRAKKLYLSAEFNKTSMDKLNKLFDIAKKVNDKMLFYKVASLLGDFYLKKKNYFFAVNYYFDACDTIKKLVLQIPEEYRLKFIKIHNMLVPFNKLYDINNNEDCDKILEKNYDYKDNIYKYTLNEYFDYRNFENILNNRDYIKSAKKLYALGMKQKVRTIMDIISNLPDSPIEGLMMMLQYMSTCTLATKAMVVLDNGIKEFSVIVSLNGEEEIETIKYILERTKSTKQPVLITEYAVRGATSDIGFMPLGAKAVMCIPILIYDKNNSEIITENRRREFNYNSQLRGILYFESDKVLNNFNNYSLKKCCDLSRMTGGLIEKYQLIISSSIDRLTKVYTRKYLEDFITDTIEISSEEQNVFSIIMFDFDLFKSINDKYGHQTGDEVLRRVCNIIKSNIRKEDICGRYGGEEFIVVLPGANKEQAYMIAEKLRSKVENEKILGNNTPVTISLGISTYPEHGHWKQELIEKADQALYISKQMGRNRSQLWNNGFSSKIKSTNKLTGIITGNSVQDYRNVLAMADISELIKVNVNIKDKIYNLLGRIIETTEAQRGMLFIVDDKNIIDTYGREIFYDDWVYIKKYNEKIILDVIEKQQGVFIIDWDTVVDYDVITGIPDWQSIIVVPLICNSIVRGVLYLTVSTTVKEFNFSDFNFVNLLAQIAAAII